MKNDKKSTGNRTDPRTLAIQTLIKVESGQYANIALDTAIDRHTLSREDRALYTTLVYGVLERRVSLDIIIAHFSSRSLDELDATVMTALRIGLYQLIYLDRIPDFAAINETVSLVPRRVSGFVNAILRSYLRAAEKSKRENEMSPLEWEEKYPELASDDGLLSLSAAYSIPLPLCRRLCEVFGRERAESVMSAFSQKPPMSISVNTLKTDKPSLMSEISATGIDVTDGYYAPRALKISKGSLSEIEGFDDGRFFVQDEASQMCVEVLGAVEGDIVIDTCSCPGSKSFGSAIRMNNKGKIYSFDLHESKLSLVKAGASRLGIDIISTQKRDARQPDEAFIGCADRVLCDVPCSGLGVIAKKPEIRMKNLDDVKRLPEIQADILEQSSKYLKDGGVLVYSTCTILPEENENVIADFLSRHTEFSPLDFELAPSSDELEAAVSKNGCLTLLPDKNRTDGFFIARLKKN